VVAVRDFSGDDLGLGLGGRSRQWNRLHLTAVIAAIRAPGPRRYQEHAATGHDRHELLRVPARSDTYFF
jgi:hypothetical protein